MARKKRRRNSPSGVSKWDINKQSRRDDYSIASGIPDGVFEPVGVADRVTTKNFDDFIEDYPSIRSRVLTHEDRRTHYPGGRVNRPPTSSRSHLAKTKPTRLTAFSTQVFNAFKAPQKVAICVRRSTRKEVLHALGKSGRGSRFHKKPRRNFHSNTRC